MRPSPAASRHPRRILALLAGVALAAAGLGHPASASAPTADGLTLVAVNHSLLGDHYWYQQTYRGIPVLGGYLAKHVSSSGKTVVDDGRIAITGVPASAASVNAAHARTTAAGKGGGTLTKSNLVIVPGSTARLAWQVVLDTGRDSRESLVDARSGALISSRSLVKQASGTGTVFEPNPVVTLQNESLTDASNANSPAFASAYKSVTLTNITSSNSLVGSYANNVSKKPVTSSSLAFNYNRSQVEFEQVMGYYHITKAQLYIQSLGFTNINNESQDYRTTGYTADNSYYDPATDRITYGTGGVDDAEDAEVIWHEYGHAIQDAQVPGFGSGSQAGAIGEGFGDYWAMTMSSAVSANTTTTPLACIADWDSVSYTSGTPHCLRRVDGNKVYPANADGEVHDDGEIWSRALWDIYNALGRTTADKIILEAQFSFSPGTTFAAAANNIVATAQSLYGASAASACTTAMHNRGFI